MGTCASNPGVSRQTGCDAAADQGGEPVVAANRDAALWSSSDLKAALLGVSEDSTPKSLLSVQKKWRPYRELRKVVRSAGPGHP